MPFIQDQPEAVVEEVQKNSITSIGIRTTNGLETIVTLFDRGIDDADGVFIPKIQDQRNVVPTADFPAAVAEADGVAFQLIAKRLLAIRANDAQALDDALALGASDPAAAVGQLAALLGVHADDVPVVFGSIKVALYQRIAAQVGKPGRTL